MPAALKNHFPYEAQTSPLRVRAFILKQQNNGMAMEYIGVKIDPFKFKFCQDITVRIML